MALIGVAVAVVVVLGAGWYFARRREGLLAAVAWAGRAWHGPGRLWRGRRRPARAAQAVQADVVPADRRPFTPRDHLNAIRRDIASSAADNGAHNATGTGAEAFTALAAGGDVLSARLLASFAAQRGQAMASERSSLFYLASRFTDTAGETFFAELAGTFRQAADMLGAFAESLGAREPELRAREPLAGCHAYPAHVAWLAQNASAEDAALALVVSLGRWGEDFGSLAAALRKHPSFPRPARPSGPAPSSTRSTYLAGAWRIRPSP
ncbi:MAG: hypothetical protein ACRDN0_16590 [Trebonia sp.]